MEVQSLKKTALFCGMSEKEIAHALAALSATEKKYRKNAAILHAGGTTKRLGLVLSGSVTVESNDMWGNRTILSHIGAGQIFAETYALLETESLLVDVTANEDCRILFLRIGGLGQLMPARNIWTQKLLANLLTIAAHKNLILSGRSFHTAPKTIRGRVMSYLNSMALQKGSNEFDIPFNRQQLADYLNLERTALSKELGKMRQDGILSVRKNHFIIYGR